MSNQFPSTDTVEISNIQLNNIPSRSGTYLVEISNEGVKKRSQKKKVDGDHIVWPEALSFTSANLTDQSLWDFKIVKTRLSFIDIIVVSHKKKLLDLLQSQEDCGSCKLTTSNDYQLVFTIERRGDALPDLVDEAENGLTGISTSERPTKIAKGVMKADGIFVDQEDLWVPFLSHFETFMNIIDTLSEVHPYVQLAWSILSVIPKTIISQNERNDSINELSQNLKEVYEYITDAKRLLTLKETQVKALSALVQQTIECAYFLKEYAALNKASKILKGVEIDKKVNDFNKQFDHILNVMTNSATLEINIVMLRTSNDIGKLRDEVKELKNFNLLEGMPRARNSGFLSSKACLSGTRQGLITGILDWVNGGSERLFLLLGQAGTGKSAVAHTISQIFKRQNRLGSLFCFNQTYKDTRNLLFSTITRELADGDAQWRKTLVQIIEDTSIRTSLDIVTQFDELIVKPSKVVNTIGPVVIVIDGMDESGDRGERAVLLNLLFKRCSELPSNYRFVITSRPESDIEPFCKHPTVFCKRMSDVEPAQTTKDIQKYISSRLSSVENILNNELDIDWRLLLAKRAEGIFQWANLACDIIDPTVEFEVAEKVKTFTSGPTSSLYQMYHHIFLNQPEFRREGYLPTFKAIMGALVILRKPLSIQALQSLFQNEFPHKFQSIMAPLHSLFLGTHDICTPVRPLHTSLTDFLTAHSIEVIDASEKKNILNQFYVDASDQGHFTLACLKLMNSGEGGLRFNICNLDTSHLHNRDVPGLDDRVQKKIPSHLSYAICFWAMHLQHSNDTEDLLVQLRLLMRTNLLYLFEAVSLMDKSVEQVCISMRILANWCKDVDDELASQAQDACQFGSDFGDAMVTSTPHLYISALPFAPNDLFIRNQYLDLFPHHFNIESEQSLESHRDSIVIKQLPSRLTAMVFSPQGRYIATGFENGDFWLWDYNTGAIVYQCENDERGFEICTIVFSPNGESVTSCFLNGKFKTLNIKKGELVDHSYGVFEEPCIYATISSDEEYLVFHSSLGDASLYNLISRSTIRLGFWGTQSIFSPNRELLAILNNQTVSLWSIQKQELIGSLYCEGGIRGMAFSPDGHHMALYYWSIVQIWDVLAGEKVSQHHSSGAAHARHKNTIMFSPNGLNLFLLTDFCIHIMDTSTGALVQKFPCHNVYYDTSFAVSPHCKHVAWTTRNDVIQVRECDITPRKSDPIDDELHYLKAIFSPLNTYLVLECYNDSGIYLQILNTATMIIISQLQQQLRNHIFAISPNDECIAHIATSGLCLWSEKGGELVLDTSDREFTTLAFSFLGDCLITGDRSGTLMVWNTHTCQLVCSSYDIMLLGTEIMALAFSRTDAQFLVVHTSGSIDRIGIHNTQSAKLLRHSFIVRHSKHPDQYHPFQEYTLAFSANEAHIVYIHLGIGIIADAKTGWTLKRFEFEHMTDVPKLKISPNRKYIVWTGEVKVLDIYMGESIPFTGEEKVEVWDIDAGKAVDGKWQDCHAEEVVLSNSSEQIVTMDETGEINFWDINSGNKSARPVFYYCFDDSYPFRRLSMNNKYLVLQHRNVEIWSLGLHKHVFQHQSNGRELRTFSVNHSKVELFDGAIHDQSSSRPDDQERIEYALVAWEKALFSQSSKITEDGWVLGPNEELLFWIPKEQRRGFWRPQMAHVEGSPSTKLTFDNFSHGSKWTECKEKL